MSDRADRTHRGAAPRGADDLDRGPAEPHDPGRAASASVPSDSGARHRRELQDAGVVTAAGTLPWRTRDDRLQVALVHRPRYDDWSWPKGKLEDDEAWVAAAVRETAEETGLNVRLGLPLPQAEYEVNGRPKVVRYWAATVVGGAGDLDHEVDEVVWCDAEEAGERLTYAHDRDQLHALEEAFARGTLTARPFGIVRHGKARPRKTWKKKPDWKRPLESRGRAEAKALVGLLDAYGVDRVVSSTSRRCVDTVKPYVKSAGVRFVTTKRLSEEGHRERPAKARQQLEAELARDRRVAVCSHGPVLPDLVGTLEDRSRGEVREVLAQAAREKLVKGELLVAHVVDGGTDGTDVRVVAVERHTPPDLD